MSHPTSLFFFGTLRHPEIASVVLGRPAHDLALATLEGYRVSLGDVLDLPVLTPEQGHRADGLLAENLTPNEVARLNFYEGGFDYTLHDVTVKKDSQSVSARAYFTDGIAPGPNNWDFEQWSRDWADLTILAAKEAMGHFGKIDAAELARRFPQIRVRAGSLVRARTHPSPKTQFGLEDVEVIERRRPYDQFFALDELDLRHAQYAGGARPEMTRCVLVGADAATVLPYDPVRDRVLVIEQFRAGPLVRGDTSPWLVEPIAGRMDPGETPQETARREAREEAGLDLNELIEIGGYYPSPSAFSEYLFSFIGLCDLPDGVETIGGLADEAEDIQGRLMAHDAFQAMVASGGAANGPLLISAMWLAQNRERLRTSD